MRRIADRAALHVGVLLGARRHAADAGDRALADPRRDATPTQERRVGIVRAAGRREALDDAQILSARESIIARRHFAGPRYDRCRSALRPDADTLGTGVEMGREQIAAALDLPALHRLFGHASPAGAALLGAALVDGHLSAALVETAPAPTPIGQREGRITLGPARVADVRGASVAILAVDGAGDAIPDRRRWARRLGDEGAVDALPDRALDTREDLAQSLRRLSLLVSQVLQSDTVIVGLAAEQLRCAVVAVDEAWILGADPVPILARREVVVLQWSAATGEAWTSRPTPPSHPTRS